MVFGFELIVTFAELLLDFLGDQIHGGIEVVFRILGEKVGAGNGQTNRAGELLFGRLELVEFKNDAGINRIPIHVFQLVDAGNDVVFHGFGHGDVVRRENQFHIRHIALSREENPAKVFLE